MSDLMKRLRSETMWAHDAMERTSFNVALLGRTLPLDSYISLLACYRVILYALEKALAESKCPAVQAVWTNYFVKVPALTRDLSYFSTAPVQAPATVRLFVNVIEQVSLADPLLLLGYLYVMEGSTLGGLHLRPHIVATYGLVGDEGTEYFGSGDRSRWDDFSQRMELAVETENDRLRVVEAANYAYWQIGEILQALSPDIRESQPSNPGGGPQKQGD